MIQLENVHKAFGHNQVLQGVTLQVPQGRSLVIIGGSGSGKSVILKCILGLLPIDRGRILVNGQAGNLSTDRAFLARFGMLFQGGALFDSLPVWQNVAFALLRGAHGEARTKARVVALEKLRRVGLGARVADLYPSELSGGMQKRVGIARAIASEPAVMFFDEPTSGLDPIMTGVINDLIRGLVRELNATAITITHDMRSARAIADHVAMLHEGVIEWHGPAKDMDTCGNPYLEQFINARAQGPIKALG